MPKAAEQKSIKSAPYDAIEAEAWTINALFEQLGKDTYVWLKSTYDPKAAERQRKRLPEVERCFGCGRSETYKPANQRAHIDPVAEGSAVTEDNGRDVIFLCNREKPRHVDCCHWLYDNGYASVGEVRRIVQCVNPKPFELGELLRARYRAIQQQPRDSGNYGRRDRDLEAEQVSLVPDPVKHIIERAEIARRRPKAGSLQRAHSFLDKVDPNEIGDLHTRSWYHYERAYAYFLQRRLQEARCELVSSLWLFHGYKNAPSLAWRWAAHQAVIAQIDVVLATNNGIDRNESCSRFESTTVEILDVVLQAERQLANGGDPWTMAEEERRDRIFSGRWVLNSLYDLCRINVFRGNIENASKYLHKADDQWKERNLANGWESAYRPLLVAMRGHVKLLGADNPADYREAIGFLTRALVMFRGRKQQPESVADTLRGIGKCLRNLNDTEVSVKFYAVAARCHDVGAWGLWTETK